MRPGGIAAKLRRVPLRRNILALGLAACSGETSGDSTVADDATLAAESSEGAGEHAEGTVAREGGDEGEHTEGGEEARESGEGEGEHGDRERGEGGEGEHGEEGGHDEEGGEGEESGIYVARGDTWDAVRRGARLVLAFNAASGAFEGTVHNTTNGTLCAVRVEVHLGDGARHTTIHLAVNAVKIADLVRVEIHAD